MGIDHEYINKYPVLDTDQEKKFIVAAQAGDKKAFDYLVISNSRLVAKMAYKLRDKGIPIEDLEQTGTMGLMRAIEKFDTTKNLKLSTYSFQWIQQYMLRSIQNDSRLIRIPVHKFQRNFQLIVAVKQIEMELGRPAKDEELAEFSGKTLKQVEEFRKDMIDIIYLNGICKNADRGVEETIDVVKDTKVVDVLKKMISKEMVDTIKDILTIDEFKVFSSRMGLDDNKKNNIETAKKYKIDIKEVVYLYKRCIVKLKRSEKLKAYQYS